MRSYNRRNYTFILGVIFGLSSCKTPPKVVTYKGNVPDGVHWSSDTIGSSYPINLSESIDTVWSIDRKNKKDFMAGGYSVGDTIPQILLYNTQEELFNLDYSLNYYEYVIFVSGSYTCPMFYKGFDGLNEIAKSYSNVQVVIVNTVNAHPEVDLSPYLGEVWDNVEADTTTVGTCRLARTLGERMEIANEMVDMLDIDTTLIEVIVDNVENEWWMNFGMIPNGAYLISKNRKVVYRQPKFLVKDMIWKLDNLISP